MLKFLAAQLDLPAAGADTPDPLRRAIAATQEPRADTDNPAMRIGLGWHITKANVLWHNGQTGGYHSFVAFDRKAKVGVVLLTNTATMDVDKLGTRALATLLKAKE
jgi:CubicO group peptidase (beta-lactamase class C family)